MNAAKKPEPVQLSPEMRAEVGEAVKKALAAAAKGKPLSVGNFGEYLEQVKREHPNWSKEETRAEARRRWSKQFPWVKEK